MMKFLRSQSQTVLVIVLGFIALGFLFYGNSGNLLTGPGAHVSNDYGAIESTDLTVAELFDAVRNVRNAVKLGGHPEQLNQPGSNAIVAEEAWRQLLLLHEADRLHIEIGRDEVVNYIRGVPLFQKDGSFDPDTYKLQMTRMQNVLRLAPDAGPDPLANVEDAFETIVRNNLRMSAVKNALFSSVRSSSREVETQYEKFYGPVTVDVIRFDPKAFAASATVTPDEIENEYKSHPENPAYRTKEERKVDYVLFPLTPEQTKLPADQKQAAIETLGQQALDFAVALQPEPSATAGTAPTGDFFAEAKKRGLTPVTTDFFAADTPPTGLPPSPSFNNTAFALTKDNPVGKIVELDNGVAVLHLAEIKPSELKPLDQVRDGITAQLRETKGEQNAQAAAESAAKSLQQEAAKGTDFKAAAAALKLNVESIPSFVPYKAPDDVRMQTIADATTSLSPGQVSDPVPLQSDNSELIVHLDSRAKADPAGLADFEAKFRDGQDQELRQMAYVDWADWMSSQPGTRKPPQLDAYGGAE